MLFSKHPDNFVFKIIHFLKKYSLCNKITKSSQYEITTEQFEEMEIKFDDFIGKSEAKFSLYFDF